MLSSFFGAKPIIFPVIQSRISPSRKFPSSQEPAACPASLEICTRDGTVNLTIGASQTERHRCNLQRTGLLVYDDLNHVSSMFILTDGKIIVRWRIFMWTSTWTDLDTHARIKRTEDSDDIESVCAMSLQGRALGGASNVFPSLYGISAKTSLVLSHPPPPPKKRKSTCRSMWHLRQDIPLSCTPPPILQYCTALFRWFEAAKWWQPKSKHL